MKQPFDPALPATANIAALRAASGEVFLVHTGPRDTGQSDYKNRLTFRDLIRLAPLAEEAGYFAVEMHGGARFHQDLMHNRISPFDEARAWKDALRHTMTQTLIRSTNGFGYRAYPANVLRRTVEAFLPTIDVWRCFDFLNHVGNMVAVGEAVMAGGRIFEPAISYTTSDDATDAYYLRVAGDIVDTFGGPEGIILAIKDMAGVGSPARVAQLVDALLQRWPELVIDYHRHGTDGLGVPAVVAAAEAGARLIDVTDDAFSRFYGQPPVQAVAALLSERGLTPHLDLGAVRRSDDVVRGFIGEYEMWESPYRGFSHAVVEHRMPGGAFPSSFEQAEKGGFLELMPEVLRGMSLGNKIIKYFDVTPGSQITWTTWAAIVQRRFEEDGLAGVRQMLDTVEEFVAGGQDFDGAAEETREVLLNLYSGATDDLKNLLRGAYGPLPFGWPAAWVYRSVFGDDAGREMAARAGDVETHDLPDLDVDQARARLAGELDRPPTDEELILYLQHPQATVDCVRFRERFGDTTSLPTRVWFHGLREPGDAVEIEVGGKPARIELVSLGAVDADGRRAVVLSVDNVLMSWQVEMPEAAARGTATRMATPGVPGEIGAPVKGNLWRIGDRTGPLAVGDSVEAGQEVANIEVMKTENMVVTPVAGTVVELVASRNDTLEQGQLIMVIEPAGAAAGG